MLAVIGIFVIMVSAGGVAGVLPYAGFSQFTWLAIGIAGAVLLVAGVNSNDYNSRRNGNIRKRG